MNTLDIIYFAFIGAVIAGGIVAIIILCPKENKLRQEKSNCYRFFCKNDQLTLSTSLPSLFEKWTGKPIYIEKGPFEIEIFIENAKGKDGKSYKCDAIMQLYLPESGAQTAAEYLYTVLKDFSQESIAEMLHSRLKTVTDKAMNEYEETADMRLFTEKLRVAICAELGKFGYDLYCPPSVKIAQNKNDD